MDNIFTPCQIVCLIPNWRLPKLDDVCVYSIVRLKYCMRSKSLLFLGPWCWWETKQHVSAVKAQYNCHKTVFTSFRRWNRITRRNYNWYEDILQFIFDNECFDEQIKRIMLIWYQLYDVNIMIAFLTLSFMIFILLPFILYKSLMRHYIQVLS